MIRWLNVAWKRWGLHSCMNKCSICTWMTRSGWETMLYAKSIWLDMARSLSGPIFVDLVNWRKFNRKGLMDGSSSQSASIPVGSLLWASGTGTAGQLDSFSYPQSAQLILWPEYSTGTSWGMASGYILFTAGWYPSGFLCLLLLPYLPALSETLMWDFELKPANHR